MSKTYEQKKQELLKRFEDKKTKFLNNLFSNVKDLQDDLNDLGLQYKESESNEAEEVKAKKEEVKTESKKK